MSGRGPDKEPGRRKDYYTPDGPLELLEDDLMIDDGCWGWKGNTKSGYGVIRQMRDGQRPVRMVHRMVYELMIGPIPEGYQIDHLCRNVNCARPDHLEAVSGPENMRRRHEYERACIDYVSSLGVNTMEDMRKLMGGTN